MFARIRSTVAALGACAAIVLHGTAAANVLFSGSGTWAGDATFSSISAPAASWSFLFVLPSTTLAGSSTTAISSFSYRLDGVTVAMTALSVNFYGAQDGGMFDITFGGATPALSLYGNAILAGGSLSLGNYSVFAGVDGSQPVGDGSLSLVQVPVPEPAAWATFGIGLAAIAALRKRRRRFVTAQR